MALISASEYFALLEPSAEVMSPTPAVFKGKDVVSRGPFWIWYILKKPAGVVKLVVLALEPVLRGACNGGTAVNEVAMGRPLTNAPTKRKIRVAVRTAIKALSDI
jgi:hypothetical protein